MNRRLTPLPIRELTRFSNPTNAPEQIKRMFEVSTTNVSAFPAGESIPKTRLIAFVVRLTTTTPSKTWQALPNPLLGSEA